MTGPLTTADTRLDPPYTRRFGVEELHAVYLQHKDDGGGCCSAVGVSVPELPRPAVEILLGLAGREKARVQIICDTHDQAAAMYRLARRLLPDHRFVALERVEASAWGQLT